MSALRRKEDDNKVAEKQRAEDGSKAPQPPEDDSKVAQPLEFSSVICFLQAQTARPFFSYPFEPVLSIAPDINRRGGLDKDQQMAIRQMHFPQDRRGEYRYFKIFCKVQRGKSKQLKMS